MSGRQHSLRGTASGDGETVEGVEIFRVLIEHWIEHNAAHGEEFEKWARRAGEAGLEKTSREISAAADCLRNSTGCLRDAMEHLKSGRKEKGYVSE